MAAHRVDVLEKELQDPKDENECVWNGAHGEEDAIFAGVFTRYIFNQLFIQSNGMDIIHVTCAWNGETAAVP